MSIEKDADFKQKATMMQFLWGLGYWVKPNVKVSNFQFGEKKDIITDIDVLAINFDFDFTPRRMIVDCTTAKRAGKIDRAKGQTSRLFWIAGLMKYLKIEKAFLIRSFLGEEKFPTVSQDLKIIPIHDQSLQDLMKNHNIPNNPYLFIKSILKIEEEILNLLKRENNSIFEYLTLKYWEDNFSRQIRTLVSMSQSLGKQVPLLESVMAKEFLALRTEILNLLSLSVLQFCKVVLLIPEKKRHDFTFNLLMGGETEYIEKEKVLDSFFKFMKQEIKERYGKTYPVSKKTFISSIYPPYFDDFSDLINHLCHKLLNARQIPRLLYVIKCMIINDKLNFNELLKVSGIDGDPKTLKSLRDILIFALRARMISKEEFDKINSFLN